MRGSLLIRLAAIASLGQLTGCGGGGSDGTSPSPAVPPPASPPPPVSDVPQDPLEIGHPTFLSPHSAPIAVSGSLVFVVNTPNDTLDVIDADTRTVIASVDVGIDPVGVAVRPDGGEVWVSNHVSDSVSVIDAQPASATFLEVVATIQDLDPATRATRFDEPVGIAFASNAKAYVALSSENQVAVVDVDSRRVIDRLPITAQDPRALVVRDGRLYVIPFESNNQTQISGCVGQLDGDLCTFDAVEHVITNNNVLSLNAVVDIVKNPRIPDHDLFVFDTSTDQLVDVVDTLGTLLYGLAVDSTGRVFVAQADARNDVNGRAGTLQHGLAEMENRAFLNRITSVDCGTAACGAPGFIDLESLPPADPAPGMALATPFAIQVSDDDTILVATAAGSNKVFTIDAATGAVLGRVEVDAAPRGIALVSDNDGSPQQAWIFNAVENSVSLVDVSDPANPGVSASVALEDPTHPAVKAGRAAFNDARASTTGTFSCESCHPDGGTDQLLWVLDTPVCNVNGCTQIPPRITMPIRGLRDTAPYHWDGIPGDPYGGNNTANIRGSDAPNCSLEQPESCTRFLVDGSLATTLCTVGGCPANDEGKAGALSAAERDAMATFLLSVPYPPAQRRAYDNVLSSGAVDGFRLFHIDGDLQGDPEPNVCGNCHRMPFWVSTNTPGTGMDAPTWRGAYDRWLILPQGRLNIIDFDFYRSITALGIPEENMWRFSWASRTRFNPVWNMVLEGSTGFSGAFARQLTLNRQTAGDAASRDLLGALEQAAADGAVVLQAEGLFIDGADVTRALLQFDAPFEGGTYVERGGNRRSFTRDELLAMAAAGEFLATFTGRIGRNSDVDSPQPALWTASAIQVQSGPQRFPAVAAGDTTMTIRGRHIRDGAAVFVDGRKVVGEVSCEIGELPACGGESIEVRLETLPVAGMHFLQVQNPGGLFSNDFIFHVQ
jgi:YVTN family beta-propeller protein